MSKTLFEQIVKETEGKKKSSIWFRNKVRQLTISGGYNLNPGKLLLDERKDSSQPKKDRDSNKLTRMISYGKLYMFDYKPKYENTLPVYDTFPFVYIMGPTDGGFYGLNLHYLKIERRLEFLELLKKGQVSALKGRIYKYLFEAKYMNGIFLEIKEDSWDIAANLPVENFFSNVNGIEVSIPKKIVWTQTDKLTKSYIREKRRIGRIV